MAAMVKFKITGGQLVPEIEMPASATILDLKKRIQSILDVGVSVQTLRFNSQVLTNERKIDAYNFGDFATLVLVVSPLPAHLKFKIYVTLNYQEFVIMVKETTLVAELKRELSDRLIIASRRMNLYRFSNKMKDELPLSAYYVVRTLKIEVTYNF